MHTKKKIIIISLVSFALSIFAVFIENPSNLIVSGNVIRISSEIYEVSPYNLKIAWQQRQDFLCGELGYTTDMFFSYGIVNYKLSQLKNLYGLNIKVNVLPIESFFIKLDAGGSVLLDKNISVDFSFNDLTIFAMDTSMVETPKIFANVDFVMSKNFDLFLSINNFETDKLRFSVGVGIFGFSPMINRLSISYRPIYRISDAKLFHFVDGILQIALANFNFSFSGFYNLSDIISTDTYLKDKYGIRISLGVNM